MMIMIKLLANEHIEPDARVCVGAMGVIVPDFEPNIRMCV